MSDNPFQSAYDALVEINTKPRRRAMVEERDALEVRKIALSGQMIDVANDIKALESMAVQLAKAISVKVKIREEIAGTYEATVRTQAELDVRIQRLEVG